MRLPGFESRTKAALEMVVIRRRQELFLPSSAHHTCVVGRLLRNAGGNGWVYIDGENFSGVRADIALEPEAPDVKMASKALYSSKDTWMGPTLSMGAVPSIYNLTMDPYEKYDMMFNGAVATRNPPSSAGRYAGMDNGWSLSLIDIPLTEFNQSIVKYPNITRFPGGASNDMIPNLQNPQNPLPYDPMKVSKTVGAGGG